MSPRAKEIISGFCGAVVFGSAACAIADVESQGFYGVCVGAVFGAVFGVWMERVRAVERAEAFKTPR